MEQYHINSKSSDTIFRKIKSIILGIMGGFVWGMIIGTFVAAFYLGSIKKIDIGGEDSLAVAVYGALFGIPIGVLGGLIISYLKRNNKWWRIFFFISAILFLLQYSPFQLMFSSFSLLGEAINFFK